MMEVLPVTAPVATEKRPQHRAVVTRDKILANAAYLFDQYGYSATSLNDICAPGITKGAVYYHFSSKDDIASALIGNWVDAATGVRHTLLDGDRRPSVIAHLVGTLAVIVCNDTVMRAGLKLTLDRQVSGSAAGYVTWTGLVHRVVRDAINGGHLPDVAAARNAGAGICAAMIGHLLAPDLNFTYPGRCTETTHTLLRGLATPTPDPEETSL